MWMQNLSDVMRGKTTISSLSKMNMNVLRLLVVCILLGQIACQSCEHYPANTPVAELVVNSPIIVEASLNSFKLQKLNNVTAKVTKAYPMRSGGLKAGSVIHFSPIGKSKECLKVKAGKTYILFLKKSENDDFYWVTYNPMKRSKSSSRSLRKLLCKNCLIEVSFKKNSIKTLRKNVGDKLKIKCKASGKPAAKISWYHNGVLLTKDNTPKEIKIKNRRKGGSGSLQIKKLQLKHNNDVIVCSATNIVSTTPANSTSKLIVTEPVMCKSTCTNEYNGYCMNDGCCQQSTSTAPPTCICTAKFHGERCRDRIPILLWKMHGVEHPNEYGYEKKLIAILGLCIGLMFVLLFSLSVYCLFKKRRRKMHLKLLTSQPNSGEQTPTLPLKSDASDLHEDSTRLNSETINEPNIYMPDQLDKGYVNNMQPSPTHFERLGRNASMNGSKRKRLNGVAKNSFPPHKKLSSSTSLPTEQHVALLESSKTESSSKNAAKRTVSCLTTFEHFENNSPTCSKKQVSQANFKSTLQSIDDGVEVISVEQSSLNEIVVRDIPLTLDSSSSST